MYRNKDKLILSNGREIYANLGIVGLNDELATIYEGYDGEIQWDIFKRNNENKYDLKDNEIIEICEYMIDLWTNLMRGIQGA